MGVESMLLVWGRLWLLGERVSMLFDIDLYCPHKPHLHTPVKSFLLIMKHQQCTFLLTRQHESSSGCNFNGHPSNQFEQCYSKDPLFCWVDWQNLLVWCCLWFYWVRCAVLIPKLVLGQLYVPWIPSCRQQRDSIGKIVPTLDAAPSAGFKIVSDWL